MKLIKSSKLLYLPIKGFKGLYRIFTKTRLRKILSSILAILIVLTSIRFIFLRPKEVRAADVLLGFNEGYGTSNAVNDTNSTVSAGSITNAVWKAEDLCKVGKCLYFDGTGDYVSFDHSSSLDMAASDTVTVEAWFRTPDITSGTRTLISKEEATGADGGYRIEMNSSGQIRFGIDSDNTTFPLYSVTSANAYDDNNWHHVAAVKNGTSSMTLYIDAQSVGTTSIASTAADNGDSFYIGTYFDVSASNGWSGFIDEVKVLRIARTATEVKADYTGETPSRGTSASFGPDQSYLSNGLVGYWKMDEASTGVAQVDRADSSGNGLTLTDNGTTPSAGGKFGNSTDSTPANSEYLSAGSTISGVKTITFWTYPDSTTNYYVDLDTSAYVQSSSGTIQTGTISSPKIYINGQPSTTIVTSSWQFVVVTTDTAVSASAFKVGRVGASNYMDGKMDDVRIYNRALSPAEISQLYNWAPGPVGYWKMDENTGSTIYDTSGNGNSIPLTNTTWIAGKIGQALEFNGTNSYAENTNVSSTPLVNTGDVTITAWIYRDTTDTQDTILRVDGDGAGSGGNENYKFILNNGDNIVRLIWQYDSQVTETVSATTALTNTSGIWVHLTAVRDVTGNDVTFYENGVQLGTVVSYTNDPTDGASTPNLTIGANASGDPAVNAFDGRIDDVKVYNYIRTQGQITEDMNAGHPAPGSPVGSSIAYWKFDEGSGTSMFDSSGNSRTLQFNSGTGFGSYSDSGIFNKAFSPAGQYEANITNSALAFDTNSFSISIWVKSSTAGVPGANEILLSKGIVGGSAGYQLYFDTSGNINFLIRDPFANTDTITSTNNCNSQDCYDNQWHNVIAVKTGITQIELWVDGNRVVVKNPITVTNTLDGAAIFFLANANTADDGDEFNGFIDETSIYNSVLTSDQIKLLYNQGKSSALGAISTTSSGTPDNSSERDLCIPGDTTACENPAGEWLMDENTGGTAYNTRQYGKSSTASNGTLTLLDTTTSWVPGKIGSAVKFDGVDGYILAGNLNGILASATAVTYSAWVKFTSLSDTATIMAYLTNSNNRSTLQVGSGTLGSGNNDVYIVINCNVAGGCASGTDGACYTTSNAITTGVWQHWTMVYDGTGANTSCGRINFYLDGKKQPLTQTGTPNNNFITGSPDFAIGSDKNTAGTYANAVIDQVRVYDYVRTPAQIQWEYNRGAPRGWWKLDENTGTTANDSSGNAYHSQTFNGATTWATGKRNTALTFDGTDDNVRITEGTGIDLGATTDPYTVSAWFKTTTDYTTNPGAIVAKDDGTGVYPFSLQVNTSEQPCIIMSDGTTRTLCGTATVNDGSWHLITGVRDTSADTVTLYIDGNRVNYQTDPTTATMVNDDNVSIGNSGASSYLTNDFNGQIDDVRIFNYNLTVQQIRDVYNSGALFYGPATGSP